MESYLAEKTFYRFGAFELNAQTGELSNNGKKLQLRDQPLRLLLTLLEVPGELVLREALVRRLWPEGTFVDFDRGLNKAVLHLREALGDSAEHPQYIETLPRKGYRFIATVMPDVQEIPTDPMSDTQNRAHFLFWTLALMAILAAAVALNISGARTWIGNRFYSNSQISALAVLPLENLSGDPEQEYFADGMTDELITNLAKMAPVRVVSRTSVMHYKGSRKTLMQIAHELHVDAVVEGTVQRSGDRVRVTAQLIQTSTDSHLWAESYEEDLRGILDLQRSVATDIARQVNTMIKPLRSTRPVDPAAYVAYLKGRFEFYRYTKEGWQKAIEYFSEAIQRDPDFAPAHVGLSASYLAGVGWEALPPEESPKGKAEAEKALKLDDQLASAHFVMAGAYSQEWRWLDAEKEYQRGIELDPNDALGRQWYSNYLLTVGRFQEAIAQQERARTTDPFSPLINTNLAKAYYYARQFDRAAAQAKDTLKIDPTYPAAWAFLERAYRHMGMADPAVSARLAAHLEEAQTIRMAYRQSGMPGVLRIEAESYKKAGAIFESARCYAQVGEKEQMFILLDDHFRRHYPGLSRLKVDPDFDPVRSDPHFQDLLRRVALP
ncbi:MAG: winged helix-turn-helix domain-containing protein [Acidobacteriia bacterium]|nr:winged helix-turn-helix domain-containing protein [Terriglobia bacterium]